MNDSLLEFNKFFKIKFQWKINYENQRGLEWNLV